MAKEPEVAAPVRELVPTGIVTPFGELLDDPAAPINAEGGPDVTWTPGFSEMRLARDTAIAEVAQGKRSPKEVPSLPVNVRLVRRTRPSGAPEGAKQMQSSNNGYRHVTKADVGQPWFTEIPPGSTVLPDGTIAKGDTTYMVAEAQVAARNTVRKELATRARLSAAQSRAEGVGISYDSRLMESLDAVPASRVKSK